MSLTWFLRGYVPLWTHLESSLTTAQVIQNTVRTLAITAMIVIVIGFNFPLFVSSIVDLASRSYFDTFPAHCRAAADVVLPTGDGLLPVDLARAEAPRRRLALAHLRVVLRVAERPIDYPRVRPTAPLHREQRAASRS